MTDAATAASGTSVRDRLVLDIREHEGVRTAYVTLARPEKRNGLDLEMLRALAEAPRRIAADRGVRAVILQGAGPAFCAGLDFAAVAKAGPLPTSLAFLKAPWRTNLFQQACWAWRELPVPVIAVLHGACFGGGLQLALAADFRFAAPGAELSVMEGKWGLIPDMTGSVTLRELVGMDVAKRLAMTAEIIGAEQARTYGLVTEVAEDPLAAAEALAAQLASRSPDAVAMSKRLFQRTWTLSPARAFLAETVLQARLMAGANHRIARRAGLVRDAAPAYRQRATR